MRHQLWILALLIGFYLPTSANMRIDRVGQSSVDVYTAVTNNAIIIGSGERNAIARSTYGDVAIPQSSGGLIVRYLAAQSFNGLYNSLWNLYLPNTITDVGDFAFAGFSAKLHCSPENFVRVGSRAFQAFPCRDGTNYRFSMPNVEAIGEGAFFSANVKDVQMPKVVMVPDSMCCGCTNLTNVVVSSKLTSVGKSAFMNCGKLRKFSFPSTMREILAGAFYSCGIQEVVLPDGLELIGDDAFNRCLSLKSVCIPATVKDVGRDAFAGSGVEELTISDGSRLTSVIFMGNCNNIRSVKVGSGVEEIGERAFEWCHALTNVSLSQSVGSIGRNAFCGCTDLKIELTSSVTNIKDVAFFGCQRVELVGLSGSAMIASRAFERCSNVVVRFSTPVTDSISSRFGPSSESIREVEFTDSMKVIPTNSCCGCKELQIVHFPQNLSRICSGAFKGCDKLAVQIPATVECVEASAFEGCSMTNLDLAANVVLREIGEKAFCGSRLTAVNLSETDIKSISDSAFKSCVNLTSLTFSSDVTNIGDAAFSGCSRLVSVTIPDSVTSIGAQAFLNCSGLMNIDISDKTTDIGYSVFRGCSSLTSVVIPNGVTNVGNSAFSECYSLRHITIPCSVISIGRTAFESNFSLETVYVYKGDVERVKGLYSWPSNVKFTEIVAPTVDGDPDAIVTGDFNVGFVVKPSEGRTSVEVTISKDVDATKVTVELSPKVVSVTPHGAKVKIVNGDSDITEFLDVPAPNGKGVIDLTKATVKELVVKEAMDVEQGAVIELNALNPSLTTPNTRKGLVYKLREGTTLEGMQDGDSTVGNGQPWTPTITVKGGTSGFYTISVEK